MKLAAVSFTENGSRLNQGIRDLLEREGVEVAAYTKERYAEKYGLIPLVTSLHDWTADMFDEKDALLFIGASGIAVRSIAPFVADKRKDPAVVVMDEKGQFVISLLSGHLGGANELTGKIANLTGAIPVITTATDVNGRFAVDIFAKKLGLYIGDMKMAKLVSADVLDEKKIGLVTSFPILGAVPEEIQVLEPEEPFEGKTGMVIALNEERSPFLNTLHLIPRIVTVGVGCRKGKEKQEIEDAILRTLGKHHLSIHSLEKVASIDLKAEEEGILAFCEKYAVPFETYSAEELSLAEGSFTPSPFVENVTGVDNVCERSAILGSRNGSLIEKKQAADGVTVALAVREWSVEFE
ncbi:MAG TPA: cobalt-precorrin 5A hydrolase [Candidatus Limivivens merdigallinarum]|uniref:Cobalt-precorrin 5A hydrolase n=1 Tax=Candidatus Limivivens merdigallinarum TaxID=2840859 RepID=A0A9D0ZVZ7_9FIRM|nr:cobalt-precorrin 5A hydrolase [Candidatus Limivivens merdigallinarum]